LIEPTKENKIILQLKEWYKNNQAVDSFEIEGGGMVGRKRAKKTVREGMPIKIQKID
jgi:hypothetical protein